MHEHASIPDGDSRHGDDDEGDNGGRTAYYEEMIVPEFMARVSEEQQ